MVPGLVGPEAGEVGCQLDQCLAKRLDLEPGQVQEGDFSQQP